MASIPGPMVWGGKRPQSPASALGHYHSSQRMTPLDERSDFPLFLEQRSQDIGLEMFLCPPMELGGGAYSACVAPTPLSCVRVLSHLQRR